MHTWEGLNTTLSVESLPNASPTTAFPCAPSAIIWNIAGVMVVARVPSSSHRTAPWELCPPQQYSSFKNPSSFSQHARPWLVETPALLVPVAALKSCPHSLRPHRKHHCRPHPPPTTKVPVPATPPHTTQLHASSFAATVPHHGHGCHASAAFSSFFSAAAGGAGPGAGPDTGRECRAGCQVVDFGATVGCFLNKARRGGRSR